LKYVIGLNAYHGDASACLLRDGKLIAACEEERFRRIKHWAGFPSEAIKWCLEEGQIGLADVDCVAINSDPKTSFGKRLAYVTLQRPSPSLVLDRLKNRKKRQSVEQELAQHFPGQRFTGKVERVGHHLAHMASAFLVSPFEEALAVSVDGFGDFASAGWGMGKGSALNVDGHVWFPHSLGVFYQGLTQYLGFPHYGDEYKVMGLAPYGEPKYLDKMRKIVLLQDDGTYRIDLSLFRHHKEKVEYEWQGGSPHVGLLFNEAMEDLLGPARKKDEPLEQYHRDMARSVQAMFEEAYFHLLNTLHGRYGCDTLTLAGGCAMNSVANGKVFRQTPYKRMYVQSAAGDAGGAIGAAAVAWFGANIDHAASAEPVALKGERVSRPFIMEHAYCGPHASDAEIAALLAAKGDALAAANCRIEHIADEKALCGRTAEKVADGQVIGWFQGELEWGPRALGNRSIVCDPRRADMKDILNSKIKRRESFRPFAPSVQQEHVAEWFEESADVPFMMSVYQIQEQRRAGIPAVTHVDGSGRLQSVYKETNRRYWQLIEAYRELTGVPMVLNTSFNENEPVVCRPHEALDCFLRTQMDVLVLGDYFIWRQAD
jgi:carbamoyltransferase